MECNCFGRFSRNVSMFCTMVCTGRSLLMVTELPNVEDSCELLETLLKNDTAAEIRDDVETV